MTSLTVSSLLLNATAQNCVKWVWPAKSRIIRPPFNTESRNFFTNIYADLVFSEPNRIWRHHLFPLGISRNSNRKKRPKMPPPMALGWIFVARRFACSTDWWASCLSYLATPKSVSVRSLVRPGYDDNSRLTPSPRLRNTYRRCSPEVVAQQEAHQLVGWGEKLCQSTWKSRQTSCMSMMVISNQTQSINQNSWRRLELLWRF